MWLSCAALLASEATLLLVWQLSHCGSVRQLYKQESEMVQRAIAAGVAECCLLPVTWCQHVSTDHRRFHFTVG